MAEPINLNKARKAKAKLEAKATAAENRVRFGRTKAEMAAAELEKARLARQTDGAKREPK
jgi:Domain of unknown function (DUF4169)